MTSGVEFVSEAQEIIETLSKDLLELERGVRNNEDYDPDLLNSAFRAVHTLKGLASLGAERPGLSQLSHHLENTLDALRLGKLPLNLGALDLLFESVELFGRLLAAESGDSGEEINIDVFLERLDRFGRGDDAPEEADELHWLDESVLSVLTEYEEHRLRENVKQGRAIFRVHASFDLLAIDVGLEALKQKMKAYGEVITYLPSADSSSDDRIEMDVLLGSRATLSEIAAGVADDGVTVHVMSGSEDEASGNTASGVEPTTSGARTPPPASKPTASMAPDTSRAEPEPELESDLSANLNGEDDDAALSLRSLSQTVRVDLRRLDALMNLVGELNIVQANIGAVLEDMLGADSRNELGRALHDQLRVMRRRIDGLQSGILEVRMVPLGQVFDKLARVVRKVSRESDKDVRLNISGADTELDKLIVEELSDPLMHMIRNAIDHGIETTNERVDAGKTPAGRIDLRAYQKGNRVVIEVEDDGRGMEWKNIRDTAVRRGFLAPETARDISRREALHQIFEPGFSTRETASELSGRGVGMDVVKTNISRLSGMIDVASQPGRGTRFAITLPVTLAIIQALVIQCSTETFCVPLNSVLESIMVEPSEVTTVEGHEVVTLRGRTLPLLHLAKIFRLPAIDRGEEPRLYVVVVGLAQHRVGIVVDELLGQRDVVIKSLGKALSQVPGVAGATELGANRTVLLLDVGALVTEAVSGSDGATGRDVTRAG
jgi:two-component system chemotaxis sensor kinase CheA